GSDSRRGGAPGGGGREAGRLRPGARVAPGEGTSADVRGGTVRGSGIVIPGSGRGEGGGGSAAVAGGGEVGGLGPRVEKKKDLVEFLGSRPQTETDLANAVDENGDDVALKVAKPEDVAEQGGRDEEVTEADEGEGIKITDRGRMEFPDAGNADGEAGTIAFQVKPEWAGSDQTDNALLQIRQEHQWNNRIELVKNGEFLRFILTDDTGREADISVRITDWQAGDLHDVKASWGDGRTSLFIDGQLAGSNEYTGSVRFSDGTPMYVGADWRGSNYAGLNGTMYDFTVSNTASHQ
ncbi:MAG: LamG-like jellyroll fold domain-containing protein, partial [Candidatus Binatia bacterium]